MQMVAAKAFLRTLDFSCVRYSFVFQRLTVLVDWNIRAGRLSEDQTAAVQRLNLAEKPRRHFLASDSCFGANGAAWTAVIHSSAMRMKSNTSDRFSSTDPGEQHAFSPSIQIENLFK
jgi:hypothetical protein